jgi:ureidoglycolate dehydrogenase (NAD+)
MGVEVRVASSELQSFTEQVFCAAGVPPADARTEAEVLIWANLRGVDSHGVLRVRGYVEALANGDMNARPNIQVLHETSATLFIEADRALGPVVTVYAMQRAIAKAREAGIGWVLLRNTTHQGAMGYYALQAASQGLAGLTFVCSPPNMAPYGARVPGVHNSPLAIAVPAKNRSPLLLDMATSMVAAGKVDVAIDKALPIPSNWAIDREGKPTTDPRQVGALLPFGAYKASGLALMFETLSSVMAGNALLEPILQHTGTVRRWTQNSVVAAIDIATFTDLESYREHIDRLVEGVKALPTAEGTPEVLVPGEPEERVREERSRLGIPLPAGTVANLRFVAEKLSLALPAALQGQ